MSADLALIGAGAWGKNLARNFQALGALRTVCDVDPAALAALGPGFRTTTTPDDVFGDPAITQVAIAAPAARHYALARAAIAAGKDVFVEKPLCLDLEEARELTAAAQAAGRILMVGHLLQYHPSVRRLQDLVARGDLGRLQYISSSRLNLGKVRKEENALWSFAPHDLSVILSLVGNVLPTEVACSGQDYLSKGVADTTMTQLKFPGKVRAHVYVSWLNPFKEQKLTVVGSEAMAVFDDTLPWDRKLARFSKTAERPVPEYVSVPEQEPLAVECAHFLECCRTRATPRTDGVEGLRVLTVLRSAQARLDQESAPMNAADSFVHSSAVVDAGAKVGKGTKIWHFSHLMADCELGENCNLGQNVVVSPHVKLGRNVKVQNNVSLYTGVTCEDDVFLGPSVVFTNVTNPRSEISRRGEFKPTLVRKGATIGANATVLCGHELGEYCFIGAGAVVTKDVPAYALVLGNPARHVGWVCRHAEKLDLPLKGDGKARCRISGTEYRLEGGVCRRG